MFGGGYYGYGGSLISDLAFGAGAGAAGGAGAGAGAGSGAGSGLYTPEVDELLSVVQLLCVLCRAIVLAYNGWEKANGAESPTAGSGSGSGLSLVSGLVSGSAPTTAPTFGELMSNLPPGTLSDVANSLLEALEHFSGLWRRRFDSVHFMRIQGQGAGGGVVPSPVALATAGYMTQGWPCVPCRAIFDALKLPQQQSIDATFRKLFHEI